MASARSLALRLGGACLLGAALGCTQTLDFSECRDDLDCMNLQGADLICGEGNECVPRPAPTEVQCTVNSECFDLFDTEHVCSPAGTCASLVTDECTAVGVPEDANLDAVEYIGVLLPTSPPFDASIGPIHNAVVLAIEDFNARAELPGGRSVGWVACDTRGSADRAKAAAVSLVDAGIDALIGPAFSESTLAVAEDVAIPNDVFLMSPTASNKAISELDDNGLVWRTIGSDVYQASALADRLVALDPAPRRVLILAKDDAYGTTLSQDFLTRARDVLPDVQYGMLRYPDPAEFSSAEQLLAAYSGVVAMGYEHDADTVVLVGTNEVRDLVLYYLLVREGDDPLPPLPQFIVSHGAVPVMTEIVESEGVTPAFRPTLMAAIEGVSPIIANESNFDVYNSTRSR
jgi:branched-chain amino acid transport system substrate-binding protein